MHSNTGKLFINAMTQACDSLHGQKSLVMLSSALTQVQNGLAVYTTWTSIATLINLTIVLSYDAGMNESHAATLSLSLLSVEVLVW